MVVVVFDRKTLASLSVLCTFVLFLHCILIDFSANLRILYCIYELERNRTIQVCLGDYLGNLITGYLSFIRVFSGNMAICLFLLTVLSIRHKFGRYWTIHMHDYGIDIITVFFWSFKWFNVIFVDYTIFIYVFFLILIFCPLGHKKTIKIQPKIRFLKIVFID